MKVRIFPSLAKGTLSAPPSKSFAHRYLIASALCPGESKLRPIDFSEDILATIDCLQALGAKITPFADGVLVRGVGTQFSAEKTLCCRESGSTLRFLIPLCLLTGETFALKGEERLLERPLSVYEALCRDKGFFFEKTEDTVTLSGKLTPGEYSLPGDISSQFITGLLFALATLEGDSTLKVLGRFESRSYVQITLSVLAKFGVKIRETEDGFFVPGGQKFTPGEYGVEPDLSNAAFLEAFSYLGGQVFLEGLPENSLQGDGVYGAHFKALSKGFCALDIADTPDLAPILMAFAALFHGAKLTSTNRLAIKESDRGKVMAEELEKCGVKVLVEENSITVPGGCVTAPKKEISSHNDHRIAMAMAVVLSKVGGVISGAQAVKKSFPSFFETIETLGIQVEKNETESK